jgi:hypothetical protein
MTITIDLGMVVAWLVLTLLMVWAIGSFCVSHGRYMELKAREELANKRRERHS